MIVFFTVYNIAYRYIPRRVPLHNISSVRIYTLINVFIYISEYCYIIVK